MKKILSVFCIVLFLGVFAFAGNAAAELQEVKDSGGQVIAYKDTSMGLMWAAKDNGSNTNWYNAKSYCAGYGVGGYSDWRMPWVEELAGLYNAGGQNKISFSGDRVWTSNETFQDHAGGWFNFSSGSSGFYYKDWTNLRALPVRKAD